MILLLIACVLIVVNVVHTLENPYYAEGGLRVLRGNIAPDGAVVKQSAVPKEMRNLTGPARVFDSEESAVEAILGFTNLR